MNQPSYQTERKEKLSKANTARKSKMENQSKTTEPPFILEVGNKDRKVTKNLSRF